VKVEVVLRIILQDANNCKNVFTGRVVGAVVMVRLEMKTLVRGIENALSRFEQITSSIDRHY